MFSIVVKCKTAEFDESEGTPPKGSYFEFDDSAELDDLACPQCGLKIIDEYQDHEVVMPVRGLEMLTESRDLNEIAAAVCVYDHAFDFDDTHGLEAVAFWLDNSSCTPIGDDAHSWITSFREAFAGFWRDEVEYAKEMLPQYNPETFPRIPEYIVIDWKETAEQFCEGMMSERTKDEKWLMLFRDC